MLKPHFSLGLNGLELLLTGLFLIGTFIILRRRGWNVLEASVAIVLIAPIILLTVAESTQFMTMDEYGISAEFMLPNERGIHAMSYAWYFTGGPLLELPVIRVMQLVGANETTTRMLLKSAWWLAGNIIILAIVFELLRLGNIPPKSRVPAFAAGFAAVALLPTVQLALKTVNYDLFSSGLGALAVLVFVRRLVTGERGLGWIALVLAIFAAQEKLTAGPILIFIVIAEALAVAYPFDGVKHRVSAALKSVVKALILAFFIPAASLSIYRVLGPPSVPDDFWGMVVAPLSSWGQIPLGLLFPLKGLMNTRRWLVVGAAVPVGIVIAAVILASALPVLRRLLTAWAQLPLKALTTAAFFSIVSVFLIGAFSAENITAFWDPFHPASLPTSLMQRFSEVVMHTGAPTILRHFLEIVLYAFAILVVAIPTTVWLLAFVGLLHANKDPSPGTRLVRAIAVCLILGALLQPVASALAGMPFANRYFNLSLALLASGLIMIGLPALAQIQRWSPGIAAALSLSIIGGLVAETAPFRPLFAAFRPFWLSYGDPGRAELGRLNASWMGWGEEIMKGGKMLESACRAGEPVAAGHPCGEITLYAMNSGLWLPGPSKIHLDSFTNVNDAPPLDSKSFYIVDRLYLIQDVFNIPNIDADLAIEYRGYALAWIFRGDRLAASGYTFGRGEFRTF
jgi:hypothetical protein